MNLSLKYQNNSLFGIDKKAIEHTFSLLKYQKEEINIGANTSSPIEAVCIFAPDFLLGRSIEQTCIKVKWFGLTDNNTKKIGMLWI
jgi:hypothetical protein